MFEKVLRECRRLYKLNGRVGQTYMQFQHEYAIYLGFKNWAELRRFYLEKEAK